MTFRISPGRGPACHKEISTGRKAADIQAMLDAARNISAFKSTYFFSDADLAALGDFTGDGVFNAADIQGELNFLAGNSGSGSGSFAAPVPEPSTAILAVLSSVCCLARRKRSR